MSRLRFAVWVSLSLAAALFATWVVFSTWMPADETALGLTALVFVLHPVGALWMLCHCSRYEKRRWPFVFLAFVPYAFLWYYFERVKRVATAGVDGQPG